MKKMVPGKDCPYKSNELFQIIMDQLKEENLLPDNLDYYHVDDRNTVEVRDYEWDTIGVVKFGGNEGIYLDVYAIGEVSQRGNQQEKVRLGVFKTLDRSKEAFKRMGDLNAEIVFLMTNFINSNICDFEWSGYDVTFYNKENADIGFGFTCQGTDQAEWSIRSKFNLYGEAYNIDHAIITDLRDRKPIKKIIRED